MFHEGFAKMNWIGCLHILIGIQPLENEIMP